MTYKLRDFFSELVILLKIATPIRVARNYRPWRFPLQSQGHHKAFGQKEERTMTYRTLDTETTFTESPLLGDSSAPVRHLRARRRASTLRHRTSGVKLSGFGI